MPGRPFGAGIREHLLERPLIVVPVPSLTGITGGELPVLLGLIDASEEALTLLLSRQVQEQLDDMEALVDKVALPIVDLAVAALPDVALARGRRQLLAVEDLIVDTDDEHFLVVGAVEDADLAASRKASCGTPEVVVVELLGRGLLERVDAHALRIDAAHHVPDGAVLARGVHGLEDDQQPICVLGGEFRLQFGEHLHAVSQRRPGFCLLDVLACVARVEIARQTHTRSRLHSHRRDDATHSGSSTVSHQCTLPRRRVGHYWPCAFV